MQTFFSNILTLMGDPHMATGHVPPGTTMHRGAALKQHGIYKHMCNFLVIANILCIFIICDHHIYALQVSFAQTRTLFTCSVVVSWFFASGYVFHTQQPEPCVSLTTPLQRQKNQSTMPYSIGFLKCTNFIWGLQGLFLFCTASIYGLH